MRQGLDDGKGAVPVWAEKVLLTRNALTAMHDKVNKKGHTWGGCERAGTLQR